MTAKRSLVLLAAIAAVPPLVAGCGGQRSGGSTASLSSAAADSAPPVATASPSATAAAASSGANGRATLTFTGAISRRLTGAPATCAYYYPSEKKGVAYTVSTSGFSLQVFDSEGDGRTGAILNATAPQDASYTTRTDQPGTVVAKLDLSGARLDVDLREVVGTTTVHVSGTITCS